MTIWIFGDSFAERVTTFQVKKHKCWYDFLEEVAEEPIVNLGLNGTGPYYLFDEFYKLYENNSLKKNDKNIFILSSPYRFPLASLPKKDKDNLMSSLKDLKIYKKNRKELEAYHYDAMIIFETFRRELDFINFKNTSFLKDLTILNEWKSIVFWVHGIEENVNNEIYNFDLYDISKLNNDNFMFFKKPLFEISQQQSLEINHSYPLSNHLSDKNHIILFNIISNFFYKTNYSEDFHSKFIDSSIVNSNGFVDFIYV